MSVSFSVNQRVYPANDILELCSSVVLAGGRLTVQVMGHSMQPYLPHGCSVQLGQIKAQSPIGSIVLARVDQQVVLHRVLWRRKGYVFLAGDACTYLDGWIPSAQVFAMLYQLNTNSHSFVSYGLWKARIHWFITIGRHLRRKIL